MNTRDRFAGNLQQDAHEFLGDLINVLHDETQPRLDVVCELRQKALQAGDRTGRCSSSSTGGGGGERRSGEALPCYDLSSEEIKVGHGDAVVVERISCTDDRKSARSGSSTASVDAMDVAAEGTGNMSSAAAPVDSSVGISARCGRGRGRGGEDGEVRNTACLRPRGRKAVSDRRSKNGRQAVVDVTGDKTEGGRMASGELGAGGSPRADRRKREEEEDKEAEKGGASDAEEGRVLGEQRLMPTTRHFHAEVEVCIKAGAVVWFLSGGVTELNLLVL